MNKHQKETVKKATQVCIIEVDLHTKIKDIINSDLADITAENQAEIEEAIADSRSLATAKDNKLRADREVQLVIDKSIRLLEKAAKINTSIPATILLQICTPHFQIIGPLIQRLKRELKSSGRTLATRRFNGESTYRMAQIEEMSVSQ